MLHNVKFYYLLIFIRLAKKWTDEFNFGGGTQDHMDPFIMTSSSNNYPEIFKLCNIYYDQKYYKKYQDATCDLYSFGIVLYNLMQEERMSPYFVNKV
jgi:hypothetical protein